MRGGAAARAGPRYGERARGRRRSTSGTGPASWGAAGCSAMDAAREVMRWKVAFYGDPRGWERAIIRPGFRHCSAFGWAATGVWLEIDANLYRIETRVLTHEAYVERLVELELKRAKILDVPVKA